MRIHCFIHLKTVSLVSVSLLACCAFTVKADNFFQDDIFNVGASLNVHQKQSHDFGGGAFIQWQYQDSWEVEASYIFTDDIEVTHNQEKINGEYDHFLLGVNYISEIDSKWFVKAGGGAGLITNSANDDVIKGESLEPYIKLGAGYKFHEQFTFEFGVIGLFQEDPLGQNYNVYLGISHKFGGNIPQRVSKAPKPISNIKKYLPESNNK